MAKPKLSLVIHFKSKSICVSSFNDKIKLFTHALNWPYRANFPMKKIKQKTLLLRSYLVITDGGDIVEHEVTSQGVGVNSYAGEEQEATDVPNGQEDQSMRPAESANG